MHGGHREFMMGVLDARQTFREFPFVMIVDIRKVGDTGAAGIVLFGTVLQVSAQYIAHRFAAGCVATPLDEFIECGSEFFIE
jgi:hypothetical protein